MKLDGDKDLRDAQRFRYLLVCKICEVTQCENFGGIRSELREGTAQGIAQLSRGLLNSDCGRLAQRDAVFGLARPDDVDGGVYRGAPKVAFFTLENGRGRVAAQKAQEDGLQDILGIGGVAGHAVGGPEDQAAVGLEAGTKVACERRNRTFSC